MVQHRNDSSNNSAVYGKNVPVQYSVKNQNKVYIRIHRTVFGDNNFMINRKSYQLIATALGLILLGSGLFGSALLPLASADDDDKKEKFKKLKEKIKKIIEEHKKKKKCKNHKYGDICDNKKPELKITFPEKNDELSPQPFVITGTAFDEISGIKEVKVRINTKEYRTFQLATLTGGDNWEFPVNELKPGKYKITAKATDFAKNSKQVKLKFKIVND